MEKININGLKLSGELVLLYLELSLNFRASLADLGQLLGDHHINISFMSTTRRSDRSHGVCCIDADRKGDAEKLIAQAPQLESAIQIHSGVGLLTLFPHQSNLMLVGRVMQSLGEDGIPIYGLASSIATITVVIDYHRLDDAAKVLTHSLQLPRSVSPMRAILKVRQVNKL